MDRFKAFDISRLMLAPREIESRDGERLADKNEAKSVCKGEVCGINWKPMVAHNDTKEDQE